MFISELNFGKTLTDFRVIIDTVWTLGFVTSNGILKYWQTASRYIW